MDPETFRNNVQEGPPKSIQSVIISDLNTQRISRDHAY